MDIESLLARRVKELRKQRQLTLEQLAEHSGVSRSMISLIERQETSPTAAVLDKLASALGVTLSALLDGSPQDASPPQPLARRDEQPVWRDPASGYLRRHVSPPGCASPIDLVEVVFPPGETVAFENVIRQAETQQQVWMLDGQMVITLGEQTWRLQAGDCLALQLGPRSAGIVFHNPSALPARYALVLATLPSTSRRSSA